MLGGVKDNDRRPRIIPTTFHPSFRPCDNPASVNKAIDLILSLCPDRDTEELIFHLQCVDETGRVVPHEETGLPTTIIKADWLAV